MANRSKRHSKSTTRKSGKVKAKSGRRRKVGDPPVPDLGGGFHSGPPPTGQWAFQGVNAGGEAGYFYGPPGPNDDKSLRGTEDQPYWSAL